MPRKDEILAIIAAEGDSLDFEYRGYQCAIRRNTNPGLGFLCGYVNVQQEANGLRLDDEINVHGGLTYSGMNDGSRLPKGYWLGFDCGHFDDLCPEAYNVFPEYLWPGPQETYRTIEYVTEQIHKMVYQLIEMEVKPYAS